MNALLWIVMIVLVISSVLMIAVVLMQETKTSGGVGAALTGSSTDSYYGKNKSKSRTSRLEFITKVLGVIIAVFSIASAIIYKY